jgi:hypothetical protein
MKKLRLLTALAAITIKNCRSSWKGSAIEIKNTAFRSPGEFALRRANRPSLFPAFALAGPIYASLKSPACSCVSIRLPASS